MYIHLKVAVGVKKEKLVEKDSTHFEVSVREKPERNLANKKVLQLISKHFQIEVKKVRIINGHHSTSKILDISE